MHSDRELIRLAAHKAALRHHIGLHRTSCVQAATRVLQPVAWLDRMLGFWRRLSPFAKFAAVPLGLLLKRSSAPRPRLLGALLRWGPVVLGAVRGLAGASHRASRG
jgi:hypothetical protein